MLSKRKRAAGTAPKNIEQLESYRRGAPEATQKLRIGTLLLAVQRPMGGNQRRRAYRLLEALLAAAYG